MKPICFIAARGGSKGVRRKNIRLFGGKPLIAHSIDSALNSNIFSHVVVSTEDKEIAKIAKKYGKDYLPSSPRTYKSKAKNAKKPKCISIMPWA